MNVSPHSERERLESECARVSHLLANKHLAKIRIWTEYGITGGPLAVSLHCLEREIESISRYQAVVRKLLYAAIGAEHEADHAERTRKRAEARARKKPPPETRQDPIPTPSVAHGRDQPKRWREWGTTVTADVEPVIPIHDEDNPPGPSHNLSAEIEWRAIQANRYAPWSQRQRAARNRRYEGFCRHW